MSQEGKANQAEVQEISNRTDTLSYALLVSQTFCSKLGCSTFGTKKFWPMYFWARDIWDKYISAKDVWANLI